MGYNVTGDPRFDICFLQIQTTPGRGGREGGREGVREVLREGGREGRELGEGGTVGGGGGR